MSQSLIQLPEEADFEILEWDITIRNHEVQEEGLFGTIIAIIKSSLSNKKTLEEFEKHKVSYEAAIEWCARELESDPWILEGVIWWHYNPKKLKEIKNKDTWSVISALSTSDAGKSIAEQIVEKIRSCDNWGDLYDEMQMTSKFQQETRRKIKMELKQQCLKV